MNAYVQIPNLTQEQMESFNLFTCDLISHQECTQEILQQLRALFATIKELAEKNTPASLHRLKSLASLGCCTSDNWSSVVEGTREEIREFKLIEQSQFFVPKI